MAARKNPSTAATCSHGHDQFRSWNRLVRGLNSLSHITSDRACDQEHIRVFRRSDEMNPEPLEVVIGIRESGDFRLASVARAGVQLPDI
jgi:hypothetical protein